MEYQKRCVNIVMKYLALLVGIVALSSCRNPSSISGYYSTTATTDFVGTNYWFSTNSTFTSSGWTCMSSDTGHGHYKLTRDSLILYYDTMEVEKMSRIKIDSLPAGGDSCELQFFLHDQDGPLLYAAVLVETAAGKKLGQVTEMDGTTVIKVPSDEFPVTVSCRYVGYYSVQTRIEAAVKLKLTVRMNQSMMHITPGGTVHAYGLKKIKRKKILLTWDYVNESGEKSVARRTLYRRNYTSDH